jgi:hypothetical protein
MNTATLESDKIFTTVVFRVWKDTGDVIALFPELIANRTRYACESYMHVGQHSPADYIGVIQRTRPARQEEYEPLLRELQSIGYRLFIRTRYTRKKGTS